MFQRQVVAPLDHRDIYSRASMVAEPELISHATDGLPIPDEQSVPSTKDEEKRRLREQEERELIMDRLMEEEKAQEDADVKVTLLKRRVDAFKQERRLARSKRNGILPPTKKIDP